MGFLTELEERIGAAVRRIFPKGEGSGVQPFEIARSMARAMEGKRSVGVTAVYVPNQFRVRLNPADIRELQPVLRTVERDSTLYVREVAAGKKLGFVGTVRLELVADESISPGQLKVEASFAEDCGARDDTGPVRAAERTSLADAVGQPTRRWRVDVTRNEGVTQEEASLEVVSGTEAGKRLSLVKEQVYLLGRSEKADFALRDTRVSKRHATVRYDGDCWTVEDQGSTNGTLCNGRPVHRERLEPGDRLTIGFTTLVFREGFR